MIVSENIVRKQDMSTKRQQTKQEHDPCEQDENYYFIAGYTSWGVPYGITWKEAAERGLLDDDDKSDENIRNEELPF